MNNMIERYEIMGQLCNLDCCRWASEEVRTVKCWLQVHLCMNYRSHRNQDILYPWAMTIATYSYKFTLQPGFEFSILICYIIFFFKIRQLYLLKEIGRSTLSFKNKMMGITYIIIIVLNICWIPVFVTY